MPSGQSSPSTLGDAAVALDRVGMAYGRRRVFDSLSCGFPQGRISVILGGSGSGKSTILRLIGGLVRPQTGSVVVDGQDMARLSQGGLTAVRQKLGMMFQGGALLDSYSVFENVALPLREQRRLSATEIESRVRVTLNSVGVTDSDDLLPGELSGGMLRRVALARAIIGIPSILLCDEPFSGLDPLTIKRLETLLMQINRELRMTMIVVSHDIHSTLRMADHILLLLGGRVFAGTPDQMRHSQDSDVAAFFDDRLEIPGARRQD